MGNSAALQDAPPPPFDVMCSISLFREAISSPYTVPSPILGKKRKFLFPLPFLSSEKEEPFFLPPSPFLLSLSISFASPSAKRGGERKGKEELSRQQLGRKGEGKKEVLHNCPHSFFRPTPSLAPSSELQEGGRRGYAETPTRKFFSLPPLFCQGKKSWRNV